jgi:hypothetical protein
MELLAVNAEQQADVIPAEDGAEDRIQFVEKEASRARPGCG